MQANTFVYSLHEYTDHTKLCIPVYCTQWKPSATLSKIYLASYYIMAIIWTVKFSIANPINEHYSKIEFSIKDFFSKCDQIRRKLWIWSHLLEKSLMENIFFLQWNYFFHFLNCDLNWFYNFAKHFARNHCLEH